MLKLGVHCSAWQFREFQIDTQQAITTQTVPNQQVQIFVDWDRQCPGYEMNFYNLYATNTTYKYADLQDNDDEDDRIGLLPWIWYNSTGEDITERLDLNFWNTRNVSLVNQTGEFKHEWIAEGHARQWQHAQAPWQYNLNECYLNAMYAHRQNDSISKTNRNSIHSNRVQRPIRMGRNHTKHTKSSTTRQRNKRSQKPKNGTNVSRLQPKSR